MDFAKAYSLYKNDKTLQILRAENFPLIISFLHLAFKQQDRIFYNQQELRSILSDYIFSLEEQGILCQLCSFVIARHTPWRRGFVPPWGKLVIPTKRG